MKITYDKEADAAYIYLEESIADGEASKTIELNDNIILVGGVSKSFSPDLDFK